MVLNMKINPGTGGDRIEVLDRLKKILTKLFLSTVNQPKMFICKHFKYIENILY